MAWVDGNLASMLDVLLKDARNPASLTFTDLPADEAPLVGLLTDAVRAARRHQSSLSQIQLDRTRFPFIGDAFGRIPVTASGDPAVLRLHYEPQTLPR